MHKIDVTVDEFKKIRKGKQTIVIRLNNDEYKDIVSKDKIIFKKGKVDYIKKKVKDVHVYSSISDLEKSVSKKQLGVKKNEEINFDALLEGFSKEDIKKKGVLGIELKPKKHIFRKSILVILCICLCFFTISSIKNVFNNISSKRFLSSLSKIENDRVNYVFVKINPSLVLMLKGNKVKDVACLNSDCLKMYDDIDIKEKELNESIDYIYELAGKKGFDTSNGIKIQVTGNLEINKKEHLFVSYISDEEKDKLLDEVKNNESIKENSNSDYYEKLWKKLKSDNDYNDVYTCEMKSDELFCHIKEDFIIADSDLYNDDMEIGEALLLFYKIVPRLEKLERVLLKFGFDVIPDLQGTPFEQPAGKLVINQSYLSLLGNKNAAKDLYYMGKIRCDIYKVNLTDINLLSPNNIPLVYDEEVDDSGTEIYKDENTKIMEYKHDYCNEWKCYKNIERSKYVCNYYESEHYGDWMFSEDDVPGTYFECDLGYKNCKQTSR